MGIFKESLPDFLKEQIRIREAAVSMGNNPTNNRTANNPTAKIGNKIGVSSKEVTLDVGSPHTWNLNKSCTIRMASCVNLIDDDILEISKNNPAINRLAEKDLLGPGLALAYILEGGTIIKGAKQARVKNDKGGYDKKLSINKKSLKRRGFPGTGRPLGAPYGDPIIRGDAKDGYGIVPMPGIMKMDVATKSAYGSLREAKVEFVCHNLRQLEILELLYMRPGYPVLLEWGWTPYINNEGKITNEFEGGYISEDPSFYSSTITQAGIQDAIFSRKKKNSGCYDGLLGLVKNFSFTLREDGGFNCTTELMGMGEVLGSLKGEYRTINASDGSRKSIPRLQQFIDKTIDYVGMRGIDFDDSVPSAGELDDKDFAAGGVNYEMEVDPETGDLVVQDGFWDDKDYELESEEYQPGFSINPQTGEYLYGPYAGTPRKTPQQVKKDYEADFSVNTTATIEGFHTKYLVSFKEDRTVWSKILSGYYDILGHKNVKDAIVKQSIQNAKIHASYIRLDALCYILNQHCCEKIPKTKTISTRVESRTSSTGYRPEMIHEMSSTATDEGTGAIEGGANFSSFQTVLYNPNAVGQDKLKPSLLNEYVHKADKIISDYPRDMLDISIDPYVCLLPKQYPILDKTPQYSMPIGNFHGYFDKEGLNSSVYQQYYRQCIPQGNKDIVNKSIGHILLNLDMLQAVHKDLYDAGKSDDYSIGAFMKKVLDKINASVGNAHNLTLQTDNQYPHVAVIVDLACEIDTSVKSINDIFEVNVQSNASAVRKFSYNSSVPSSMAATIAVGAAAADDLNSLDEVTFKSMNRGINNRLYSPPPPPSLSSTKKPTQAQIDAKKNARQRKFTQLSTAIEDLTKYSISILTGQFFKRKQKNRKQVNIQKRNIEKMHALTDELLTLDKETAIPRYNPPTPTPIPIKIDLELDGISGMVMGQLFRVDESRLPVHYRKRDIHFIIMQEKQEVTAGGDWTTTISGQMQLFPEPLPERDTEIVKFIPEKKEFEDFIHERFGLKDGEKKVYGGGIATSERDGNIVTIKGTGPATIYEVDSKGRTTARLGVGFKG